MDDRLNTFGIYYFNALSLLKLFIAAPLSQSFVLLGNSFDDGYLFHHLYAGFALLNMSYRSRVGYHYKTVLAENMNFMR